MVEGVEECESWGMEQRAGSLEYGKGSQDGKCERIKWSERFIMLSLERCIVIFVLI